MRGVTVPVSIILLLPLVVVLVLIAFSIVQSQLREPTARLVGVEVLRVRGGVVDLAISNQGTVSVVVGRVVSLPSKTTVFNGSIVVEPRGVAQLSVIVPYGDNQLNVSYTFADGKQGYSIVVIGG